MNDKRKSYSKEDKLSLLRDCLVLEKVDRV